MGNDATISVAGGGERQGIMQQGHDTNGSTSVDSARMCTGERCIDREEGFASQFYSTCLQGFQQLCRQEQAVYAPGPRSYLLKEELGKLYLWGESFSPGELDKALDEYEDIRDSVLDLLVDLGELVIRGKTSRERRYIESHVSPSSNRTLKSSVALRASSTVAYAGQIHELESSIERARFISSDVDGQEDLDVLPVDTKCLDTNDHSDDDMADFCEDAAFTIDCLTELGPSLQQNLASARKPAPPVSQPAFGLLCPSGPAGFYVSLVRDKFKRASKGLVERLGEANWQRHLRVRNMMEDLEKNPAKGQNTAHTTFHDSGIGTSVPGGTQYEPSHTSFRTSNPEGGSSSLRVPPAPLKAADGKSSRCYLCGDMLSPVMTRTQWKMHVFSDLTPYLCTFDECQHKLRSFPSRSSWADHEFQEHRLNRYWACPECSEKSCSTLDWKHHLHDVHKQKFSGPNLVAARNIACRISPKRAEEEDCPLCRVVLGKTRRAFVKHVSRHMEDIALMALPSNAEEDSETSSINTNRASVEDNDTGKDGFGDANGNTVCSERYDTGDGLILGPPEVERPSVLHSGSRDDSTPAERSPTPERMTMLKPRERRQRPRARATQGDAIFIGFMGGLNHPDLASEAGEEPLSQESDESADEDGPSPRDIIKLVEGHSLKKYKEFDGSADENFGGSENGPDALGLLLAAGSHGKSDTSPREHQASEEPLLEESDESADDEVRLGSARNASELLRTAVANGKSGTSPRQYRYGPTGDTSLEAPHLETPKGIDPVFGQQAGVSIAESKLILGPQELVKARRVRRKLAPAEAQGLVKARRGKRRFTPAERLEIQLEWKTGACRDCCRAKRKCTHALPRDHLPGDYTPSLTSSMVPINDPLPQPSQMDKSTSEAINNPTKPIELHPPLLLSNKDTDDRREYSPPVPPFRPAVLDLLPDNAPDESNSPQPVDEVRRRREPAMVDNEKRDVRYGSPAAWTRSNSHNEAARTALELKTRVGSEHWDNSHEME